VFDGTEADTYARRLRDPARAWASAMLYRSYLRAAGDVFIRRRYRHERLTVPTLLVIGAEDFYLPRSYLAGWQIIRAGHAGRVRARMRALPARRTPRTGIVLPSRIPALTAPAAMINASYLAAGAGYPGLADPAHFAW
jgi:hypothetical protein